MSSPESMAHREQDFDYEVIDAASPNYDNDDTETPVSVADHYKGTPPLKSKKKKSRYSHEIPADYQVIDFKCSIPLLYHVLHTTQGESRG